MIILSKDLHLKRRGINFSLEDLKITVNAYKDSMEKWNLLTLGEVQNGTQSMEIRWLWVFVQRAYWLMRIGEQHNTHSNVEMQNMQKWQEGKQSFTPKFRYGWPTLDQSLFQDRVSSMPFMAKDPEQYTAPLWMWEDCKKGRRPLHRAQDRGWQKKTHTAKDLSVQPLLTQVLALAIWSQLNSRSRWFYSSS